MSAVTVPSLFWILLSTSLLVSASEDEDKIKVEPGQTVTLPCRDPSKNRVRAIVWTRPDLGEEYVLFYRGGQFNPEYQHQSFKNRVELKDLQMKDGDVSLVLKNVTRDDNGTYDCYVMRRETNRRKRNIFNTGPIKVITLTVVEPAHTEEGGHKEGGDKGGYVGLGVGVTVAVLVVIAGVVSGFVILRKRRFSQQKSNQPPADEAVKLQLI